MDEKRALEVLDQIACGEGARCSVTELEALFNYDLVEWTDENETEAQLTERGLKAVTDREIR